MDEIDTGDLQFPLRIRDIGKLEILNNLAINVFSLDHKSHVIPIRISNQKEVPKERIIDLLYVVHELNTHYCLITNIAGMLLQNSYKLYVKPTSFRYRVKPFIIFSTDIFRTMSKTATQRQRFTVPVSTMSPLLQP